MVWGKGVMMVRWRGGGGARGYDHHCCVCVRGKEAVTDSTGFCVVQRGKEAMPFGLALF